MEITNGPFRDVTKKKKECSFTDLLFVSVPLWIDVEVEIKVEIEDVSYCVEGDETCCCIWVRF